MKIKELKKQIKNIDDRFEVILSSDSEGNSYHDVGFVYEIVNERAVIIYPKHKNLVV